MKLAFYYHIPIFTSSNGNLFLPGYLGVFVDALANEVDQLTLVMHTSIDKTNADYLLGGDNIKLVNLGDKTPAWHRMLFHKTILKEKLKEIEQSDILLVRSPTPLAPYFYKYLNNTKLIFLIVGDYKSGATQMKINSIRDRFIQVFLFYNDLLFKNQIKKTDIIVNSSALAKKYREIAKTIGVAKTTTLSKRDFFEREDTCLGEKINLLYTGRIDTAKGLFELMIAFADLKKQWPKLHLNYVGWEDKPEKPVEMLLKAKARDLGVINSVTFHGRKKVGDELNAMYRMSDIYIIPSYHEGFPRTIWEAMANGLPVIASRVGSIPHYLINNQEAILIEPKSVNEIKDAVTSIINNEQLRRKIIVSGKKLAIENTLEKQTHILIGLIKQKPC